MAENGRNSFLSLKHVVGELLANDPGKQGTMPPLNEFAAKQLPVPIVISWDATGFGKLKLTTIVVNNPFTSQQSAQTLWIFGLGMVDDNKDGTRQLLQDENLTFLNRLLRLRGADNTPVIYDARTFYLPLRPIVVCDLACFGHCEHLANSGLCGCSREVLREVLKARADEAQLRAFLDDGCVSLDFEQRCCLRHNCVPGEAYPRPCAAPRC
eukprot:4363496-Pleurochrysis_carterae.AAC.1